jgi:lysine-specific demethylase/histidyl-hydroxylase NO66
LAVDAIDDHTLLRRRPGHPCVLIDRGERLEVLLGDRILDVPARLRPALDEVRRHTELRPRDLPLDEQSRLVLARRLVREGLLRVVT